MELQKYTGTIHPEEWLKQVKVYCCFKGIEDEQQILKICKLMIDSTITIPNEVYSFHTLIRVLKLHSSFKIFKDSCKNQLQAMKYFSGSREENYTATFLADFRSLCNNAEINDPEEIKALLCDTYLSNKFFKNEFVKRVNEINLVDEIIKAFSDVVLDGFRIIRPGSFVTLKHVATGKYLSSKDVYYESGSENQVVYVFLAYYVPLF